MAMVRQPVLRCEEYQPIPLSDSGVGGISRRQLESLFSNWRAITSRDPASAFEYGPGVIRPTNWVGSVNVGGLDLEVAPRGATGLDSEQRSTLDTNLGTMLHHSLANPVRLDTATMAPVGSRFERGVEALCDRVARARRGRVIRDYRVRQELTPMARGQLRFPAQALVASTRPGLFASRWVELDEDTPENRFLKASLAFCRTRVGGSVRRRVDDALVMFEHARVAPNPALDFERVRWERLSDHYVLALELARDLLEGRAGGLLAGSLAGRSEVLFMPDLFQRFVGRLLDSFAGKRGLVAHFEREGRYLARWTRGGFAPNHLIKVLPDAELSLPGASHPLLILDAKWKFLQPSSPGFGITAADVHQMLAYCARLGCREAVLIYPWLGDSEPYAMPPLMEVGGEDVMTRISIVAVPLLWSALAEAESALAAALDERLAG